LKKITKFLYAFEGEVGVVISFVNNSVLFVYKKNIVIFYYSKFVNKFLFHSPTLLKKESSKNIYKKLRKTLDISNEEC
jgi:hypothetical protein